MADETLSSELELDIGGALSAVDRLGEEVETSLFRGADSFSDAMSAAIAAVPDVEITPDVSEVDPAISDAVAGADTEAEVTADASAVTTDVDSAVAAADGEVPVEASGAEAITGDIDSAVSAADSTVEVDADTAVAIAMIQALDEQVPSIDVEVTANTEEAQTSLDELSTSAGDNADAMGGASSANREFGNSASFAAAGAGIASGSASELSSAVGGLSAGTGAAVGVVGAFAGAVGVMFNEAVDATGATQRFNASLGGMADRVENLDDIHGLNTNLGDLALTLGSDDDNIRTVVARMFDLAAASGKSKQEAAVFTEQLVAMGARAVALNPQLGDVGDVADGLSTALVRGGRFASKYGLDLNQAEINSRALAMTSKNSTEELSFVEKAMAGAALATEKYGGNLDTVIAQGAENAITKQRRLKQTIVEVIESLGMPLVAPVFDIMEAAIPTVEALGKVVSTLAKAALPAVAAALDVVAPGLQAIADIMEAIPGPVLTATVAIGGLAFAFSKLVESTAYGGIGFGKLGGALDTTKGKLAVAGSGAVLAAGGFSQIGESTEGSVTGILSMAAGGALLGASLTAATGPGAALGATVGALAGATIGTAKALLSSGESLDEYRQKFEKLGESLNQLSSQKAVQKFVDELGDSEKWALATGNVSKVREELTALATTSPQAARKVVDGLASMRDEAGKPIPANQLDTLNAAVDKGTAAYQRHVVEQQRATAGNAAVAASAQANAQAQTNANAATQAAADATKAHSDALGQTTSAYQATTLAAEAQAAADANSIANAREQALATRSVSDGQAAVAQETLSAQIAYDGAAGATYRYAAGIGTAQEATDALKRGADVLASSLDLLLGRFLTADQQSNDFKLALLDLGGQLFANGFAFDENSKAGLENQNTLDALASKALSASQAIYKSTGSVEQAKQPLLDLRGAVQKLRDDMATAGQDTSFLDGLLGNIDAAVAGVGAKEPEFRAKGQANAAAHAEGVRDEKGNNETAGGEVGDSSASGAESRKERHRQAGVDNASAHNQGVDSQRGGASASGGALGDASATGAGSRRGEHFFTGAILGGAVGEGVGTAGGAIAAAASAAAGAGPPAAGGRYGDYYGAGQSSAQGLADGIRATIDAVVGAANEVGSAATNALHQWIENPPYPSRVGLRLGRSLGYGFAVGIGEQADVAATNASAVAAGAVGALDGASSPFVPGIGSGGGGGGGSTTFVFDVDVHGISDPASAREAGEALVESASNALARRGFTVTARLG